MGTAGLTFHGQVNPRAQDQRVQSLHRSCLTAASLVIAAMKAGMALGLSVARFRSDAFDCSHKDLDFRAMLRSDGHGD